MLSRALIYNSLSPIKYYSNLSDILCYKKCSDFIKATKPSYQSFTSQHTGSMSTVKNEAALSNLYKPRDIQFKTPYGHTGALEWGDNTAPFKILCSHGWLDNAGSFERLIPFLLDHNDNAKKYHIVSMDHPGVGLSSHIPAGARYDSFSTIFEMRRIAQELNWEKISILSHSLGAHLSYIYSCMYPKQVESMIAIDLTHPLGRQSHNWNIALANSMDDLFKCETQLDSIAKNPTVYSRDEAIKRLMDGHSSSLTRESAEVMLKRGARQLGEGLVFNRDIRLRYLPLELRPDDDLMLKFFTGTFQPNLLVVRAKVSPYHRPESVKMAYYKLFEQQCSLFRDVAIDGTHHLHMNNPDLVADVINKFLDDVNSKISGQSVTTKSNL